MAIIEEVQDEEAAPAIATPSRTEMMSTLRALSAKLRLPEDLLPGFMDDEDDGSNAVYCRTCRSVLQDMVASTENPAWEETGLEEQGEIFGVVTRLYGEDGWTSAEIRTLIGDLARDVDTAQLAQYLLTHALRPYFSSTHPMLNPSTSRALSRPAGGPEALSDAQDAAAGTWKTYAAWGNYNILAWCCAQIPPADLPDKIGLVLPPTLMMMDDSDPAWRGRGAWVLSKWIGGIPTLTMKRMGMDTLLLKSLIHTLSLHSITPLPHVMPLTLELIGRASEGEKEAELLSEVMDKAVLTGWMYAPSGAEGRVVLTQVAKDLEQICGVLGAGILRWMKSIIPNLLQPLAYPPTPAVLSHFEANLSALLCVMRVTAPTGRVPRWRGQILDVLSRLCIHLDEKEKEDAAISRGQRNRVSIYGGLRGRVEAVFALLAELCPSVKQDEFARLIKLDHSVFDPIVGRTIVGTGEGVRA